MQGNTLVDGSASGADESSPGADGASPLPKASSGAPPSPSASLSQAPGAPSSSSTTPTEIPPPPNGRREIRRCGECAQQFTAEAMFCPFDGTKLLVASWDPSGDPMLGQIVDGRYEVVSVLGEGGMGTVYEVRHRTLGRSFAMKVLRRDIAREQELAERFTIEAKATAAVKHPNIVAINDFGRLKDETPYFVMEMLVGETLADLIKRMGPLPPARVARIVQQIAAALRAAHEAGVVHRDLKPENVFLVGTPQACSGATEAKDDVRIVDFGAAKIAGAARLTKAGIVFGTPHYMAPEQAAGQPVDHRADVYALGVIMYVMFTSRVPFEADSYMGVLTQHMFVKPTPPSAVLNGAGSKLGALETVTLRALEKKPEDRYQTMAELGQAVERVVTVAPDGTVVIAPAAPTLSRPAPMLLPTDSGEAYDDRPSRLGLGPSRWPLFVGAAVAVAVSIGVAGWVVSARGEAPKGIAPSPPVAEGAPSIAPSNGSPSLAPSAGVVTLSAPAAVSEAATPMAKTVRITSTPSFAEVWSQGARVGTTPYDAPSVLAGSPVSAASATAPPKRYVVSLAGFEERAVAVGADSGPEVHVDLAAKAPAAHTSAPPPRRHATVGDVGDPWATHK